MRTTHSPGVSALCWGRNGLLAALPVMEQERLLKRCEVAFFQPNETLCASRTTISHVYFPLQGVISVVRSLRGETVQLAAIGSEGMIGAPLAIGVASGSTTAVCRIAAICARISAGAFIEQLARPSALRPLVHRYIQALADEISLSALCNRVHGVEERLSRSLLNLHDRVPSDDLMLTHEAMARMLGVHRPTVTEAASELQREGVVRYGRGRITILDRAALEANSCACYSVARKEFDLTFAPLRLSQEARRRRRQDDKTHCGRVVPQPSMHSRGPNALHT